MQNCTLKQYSPEIKVDASFLNSDGSLLNESIKKYFIAHLDKFKNCTTLEVQTLAQSSTEYDLKWELDVN